MPFEFYLPSRFQRVFTDLFVYCPQLLQAGKPSTGNRAALYPLHFTILINGRGGQKINEQVEIMEQLDIDPSGYDTANRCLTVFGIFTTTTDVP